MTHSVLYEFLKRHVIFRYILICLPALLSATYIYFYLADLGGVVKVLDTNDSITSQVLGMGNLYEVRSYSVDEAGFYEVSLIGSRETQFDTTWGSELYQVYIVDEHWYKMVTSNGETFYSADSLVYDSVAFENDEFRLQTGTTVYKIKQDELIAKVFLDKEGYKVEYPGGGTKVFKSLSSVDVLLSTDNGCRLRISTGYDVRIPGLEIHFCRNLPTDGIFFNSETTSLVRNVQPDFGGVFVMQSKIYNVLLLSCLGLVLVLLVYRDGGKELYITVDVVRMNLFMVIALALCGLLPYVVL